MSDERFIELAKKFLIYSFEDINFTYQYLSGAEKQLITEKEFKLFTAKIQETNDSK